MKGNEALGEAAIQGGCRNFFGYPITPQNELTEYMSKRILEEGGVFVQAESEIGAINMLFGAGACGIRAMTSSSGPGISLKQEGISYLAGAQIPAVIVNVVRAGPGLGGISPSQSDYLQATKGGGHGDYKLLVLAPGNLQEVIDLTKEAFWLADLYRNPVMIYMDAILGQMMEAVDFNNNEKDEKTTQELSKLWSLAGRKKVKKSATINKLTSIYLDPEELERHNLLLNKKYEVIKKREKRCEIINPNARHFLVAYGTTARICKDVVKIAEKNNIDLGLVRPISLWPFPYDSISKLKNVRNIICVEMSLGQMLEDIMLAVGEKASVYFYGRTGGVLPRTEDILNYLKDKIAKGELVET